MTAPENKEARNLMLVLLYNQTSVIFALQFLNREVIEDQQNAVQYRPRYLHKSREGYSNDIVPLYKY